VGKARPLLEVGIAPAETIGSLVRRFRIKIDKGLEIGPADVARFADQWHAAFSAEGTEQGVDDISGATNIERILIAGRHPAGMPDHRPLGGGQLAHELAQFGGIDAGFSLRPFRGVRFDELLQFAQTLNVATGVFFVEKSLIQQFVDDRQVKGVIGAGPHLEVAGCFGSGDGRPDVDDRQFATIFQGIHEVVDLLDIDRLEDVAQLQHHVLGVFQVVGNALASHTGN